MVSIAMIAILSTALAQNMTGGIREKSKLQAEQNMTGNATNTTNTEGVSTDVTG